MLLHFQRRTDKQDQVWAIFFQDFSFRIFCITIDVLPNFSEPITTLARYAEPALKICKRKQLRSKLSPFLAQPVREQHLETGI